MRKLALGLAIAALMWGGTAQAALDDDVIVVIHVTIAANILGWGPNTYNYEVGNEGKDTAWTLTNPTFLGTYDTETDNLDLELKNYGSGACEVDLDVAVSGAWVLDDDGAPPDAANEYFLWYSTNSGGGWTAITAASTDSIIAALGQGSTNDFDLKIQLPIPAGSDTSQDVTVTLTADPD